MMNCNILEAFLPHTMFIVHIHFNIQEGFLRCQIPTSTVRRKVEGCRVKNGGVDFRVKNGGCKIKSEELRVTSLPVSTLRYQETDTEIRIMKNS